MNVKKYLAIISIYLVVTSVSDIAASNLPDFERFPGYRSAKCQKSSGGSTDFKLDFWLNSGPLPEDVTKITKISTGEAFFVLFKPAPLPRNSNNQEYFYYTGKERGLLNNNPEDNNREFYGTLAKIFTKEDYQLIVSGVSGYSYLSDIFNLLCTIEILR